MEVSRLIRDGTAEPFSRDQIFWREGDREIVIFPVPGGCFDVYFICAHFPETDARCSCSRALPLPAAGCLNGPRSLSPGFTHYVRFCRFAECAEGSADWLKCSTRTVQAPTGGTTRCMFRFVVACSPATTRLPRNTDHPSLLAVITVVAVCIHRAHRFRCNEQSTRDATVGRELADSLKCIGDIGSKV